MCNAPVKLKLVLPPVKVAAGVTLSQPHSWSSSHVHAPHVLHSTLEGGRGRACDTTRVAIYCTFKLHLPLGFSIFCCFLIFVYFQSTERCHLPKGSCNTSPRAKRYPSKCLQAEVATPQRVITSGALTYPAMSENSYSGGTGQKLADGTIVVAGACSLIATIISIVYAFLFLP